MWTRGTDYRIVSFGCETLGYHSLVLPLALPCGLRSTHPFLPEYLNETRIILKHLRKKKVLDAKHPTRNVFKRQILIDSVIKKWSLPASLYIPVNPCNVVYFLTLGVRNFRHCLARTSEQFFQSSEQLKKQFTQSSHRVPILSAGEVNVLTSVWFK